MNGQLAQRLYGLRRANGLSQEELARKLAVSRQAVSKWECGDALPSTENLFALAELYGVGMATLMDDVRNDAREEDRRAGYDVEPRAACSEAGTAADADVPGSDSAPPARQKPSGRWLKIACLALLGIVAATFIVCCVAAKPDLHVIEGTVVASDRASDDFVVDLGRGYDYRYWVISVDSNTMYSHAIEQDGEAPEETETDPFAPAIGQHVQVSIKTHAQNAPQATNLAESVCVIEQAEGES